MTQQNVNASIKFTANPPKTESKPRPVRRSHSKRRGSDRSTSWSVVSTQHQLPTAKFEIKKGETPVRIWSLMGLEQVGQCIFIEYENDIIIVDAWMEFSTKETLGADYMIPDVSYIKKHRKKLRGIVLSHGHLDHVWALRDLLPELGYPMIYTTPLTLWIIKKTFDNKKDLPKIKYKIVNPEVDILKLWCFTIEFINVNHNIPETMAMSIHTPKWVIFNSSDFKIDHTPAIGKPADLHKIARIGLEWVKLYIGDSLWAQKKGVTASEKEIGETLAKITWESKGRIIVATFASNVWRVIQLVQSAIKFNRTVFLSWRSMVNNVEICQELWYIDAPKTYVRKLTNNIDDLPDDRVMILCTGAQWEEFSALARMARGDHAQVTLQPWDTILVSASVIPWNEIQAMGMKDALVQQWVHLVTNDDMDIHASWHGWAEDHKLMLTLVRPKFFLPYYLNAYFRYEHKKLAMSMGMDERKILMPNESGSIIEMYDNGCRIAKEKLKLDTILIDGKGRGNLSGEYVIKARQIMAEDGIVSLIFKIDSSTKELVGNVQIESRGFVYSWEVRKVHTSIVEFVKSKYYAGLKRNKDTKEIMRTIKDELGEYLNKEIGREPMIMPMYVYITRDVNKASQAKEGESKSVEPKVEQLKSVQEPVSKEQKAPERKKLESKKVVTVVDEVKPAVKVVAKETNETTTSTTDWTEEPTAE